MNIKWIDLLKECLKHQLSLVWYFILVSDKAVWTADEMHLLLRKYKHFS